MKIGIDSYCFHRFFGEVYDEQPSPGKAMTMDDFLAFAVELGVDGVSLESCFFPSMERSWFSELRARLDDLGLERVYAWGHPTGLEDGTNPAALEDLVAQIDNADLINAKVMRVTPGPGAPTGVMSRANHASRCWRAGSNKRLVRPPVGGSSLLLRTMVTTPPRRCSGWWKRLGRLILA